MSQDAILALTFLVAVLGLTPGPLALMVFSYGSQVGVRRSLPFVAGGALGYAFVVTLSCLSLAGAIQNLPILLVPAKILAALILVWFSWKIATSGMLTPRRPVSRGTMFLESCTLQSVNPKAWAAGLALATSAVGGIDPLRGALIVGAVVFTVIFAALLGWAASGHGLSHFLACDMRRRTFNFGMAGALLGVGLPGLVT
ncbi:MAG: LysE family translocator [Pseudomonadota bacterium]